MNLKEVSTVDLVHELARRAKHFDALAAFASSVHDEQPDAMPKPLKRLTATDAPAVPYKRKHLLTSKMVYEVLKTAGRPLTIDETFKRIGRGTKAGVIGQFRRLISDKKVVKLGNARPFAFQAIDE